MSSTPACLSLHRVSFAGRLKEISLEVRPGEMIGVLGANGAGKSTLIKLAAGLLTPETGEIRWGERVLPDIPETERAKQAAYLPQNASCVWELPVEEVVALGRLPHLPRWIGNPGPQDREAIEEAMRLLDILPLRGRPVSELSGGELGRVMLARVFAQATPLLLLDEPVAGFDPAHQLALMRTLRRKAEEGAAVLCTLHELHLSARFCTRLILLKEGQLLADGPANKVLNPENLAQGLNIRAVNGMHESQPYLVPWQEIV